MKLTIKQVLLASTLCAFAAGVQAADPGSGEQRDGKQPSRTDKAGSRYTHTVHLSGEKMRIGCRISPANLSRGLGRQLSNCFYPACFYPQRSSAKTRCPIPAKPQNEALKVLWVLSGNSQKRV